MRRQDQARDTDPLKLKVRRWHELARVEWDRGHASAVCVPPGGSG